MKAPIDAAMEILFLPKVVVILFAPSSSWHGGESAGFHRLCKCHSVMGGRLTVFPLARACPGLSRWHSNRCLRDAGPDTPQRAARGGPAKGWTLVSPESARSTPTKAGMGFASKARVGSTSESGVRITTETRVGFAAEARMGCAPKAAMRRTAETSVGCVPKAAVRCASETGARCASEGCVAAAPEAAMSACQTAARRPEAVLAGNMLVEMTRQMFALFDSAAAGK